MRAYLGTFTSLAVLVCLGAGCRSGGAEPPAVDPAVTIRYEHVRTCSRFMGRAGQFFALRIVGVDNRGAVPFTLQPALFRLPGDAGTGVAPAFLVPEFSDVEVAPGASGAAAELYLLEGATRGPPPPGSIALAYENADVRMVRVGAEPGGDDAGSCDEFNT